MDDQVVRGLRILSLYLNGLAMHAAVDALFEPGFADVEKIAEEDAWQVLNARKAVAADGLCERGDETAGSPRARHPVHTRTTVG